MAWISNRVHMLHIVWLRIQLGLVAAAPGDMSSFT